MKKTKKNKSRNRRILEWSLAIVLDIMLIVGVWQGYRLFEQNFVSKDGEEHLIYIYPETTVDALVQQLEQDYRIASPFCLRLHAKLMKWPGERQYARTGCYRMPVRSGNLQVIRMFRNGQQTPIELSFRNIRTKGQLSARLAEQLMLDSATIATRLDDAEWLKQYDLNPATSVCLFLPNTYEMYWDISLDGLFKKMYGVYRDYWNDTRLALANSLGFTPSEIATIASIVEEETNKDVDKPIIAGLYMNRLRIGMPLQSCPTVKFALQDFKLRHILNRHLEVQSPYNTYKNPGLPPGPIRIPTAKTMDYVLHPTKSNYLFMCASDKFDGTHHFSSNYAQHAAYARDYQRALNRRGIK